MNHAQFIAAYDVPVVDPTAPALIAPTVPGPFETRRLRLVGALRRRLRGRRLAYLDSHFPWQASGFRYADALALHEARPDTAFFSAHATTDPFPTPVLPLAEFPRLAPRLGITDVYCVFLDFAAGLLGLPRHDGGQSPIAGPDLMATLRTHSIRVHVSVPPGGGFVHTADSLARVHALSEAADQLLSWVPEILEAAPMATPIAPAVIDTSFYPARPIDLTRRPVELLFAADAKARKGLDVALATQRRIAGELGTRLHVVGPHDAAVHDDVPGVTFHGWLSREGLRTLHRRCSIFLSPVRRERPDEDDGGVTDGFPTAAAAEAMSSGCLLVTANPVGDHRTLEPGIHHLEPDATDEAFAAAVRRAIGEPHAAARIAAAGAARVRERMDVRRGARERLRLLGLDA